MTKEIIEVTEKEVNYQYHFFLTRNFFIRYDDGTVDTNKMQQLWVVAGSVFKLGKSPTIIKDSKMIDFESKPFQLKEMTDERINKFIMSLCKVFQANEDKAKDVTQLGINLVNLPI